MISPPGIPKSDGRGRFGETMVGEGSPRGNAWASMSPWDAPAKRIGETARSEVFVNVASVSAAEDVGSLKSDQASVPRLRDWSSRARIASQSYLLTSCRNQPKRQAQATRDIENHRS